MAGKVGWCLKCNQLQHLYKAKAVKHGNTPLPNAVGLWHCSVCGEAYMVAPPARPPYEGFGHG